MFNSIDISGLGCDCVIDLFFITQTSLGTTVAQWLRLCATNRKEAGSIPDGVIGNFH